MSEGGEPDAGLSVDDATGILLLLMPRIVSRIKRTPVPKGLRRFTLAPRHLSLLAYLLLDGEMGVNELASRLEVAPATASLMIGDLSRQGLLDRREDDADRRRTMVSIAERHRAAVDGWLARAADSWTKALVPLTPRERQRFVETIRTFEQELSRP
jgi:DNA-binding MarR family transcriptional regulator